MFFKKSILDHNDILVGVQGIEIANICKRKIETHPFIPISVLNIDSPFFASSKLNGLV